MQQYVRVIKKQERKLTSGKPKFVYPAVIISKFNLKFNLIEILQNTNSSICNSKG